MGICIYRYSVNFMAQDYASQTSAKFTFKGKKVLP